MTKNYLFILFLLVSISLISGCSMCGGKSYNPKTETCVKTCSNMVNVFGGDGCYRFDVISNSEIERQQNLSNQAYQSVLNELHAKEVLFVNASFYNYSFDIIRDYNLSCERIAYINDHFIGKSRQVDGGYIEGSYSGFLSVGHVEGHLYQWVTEGVLATGQLIKYIEYYLDAYNSTLRPIGISACENYLYFDYRSYVSPCMDFHIDYEETKKVAYYSESDFVMYYISRCLS